MKKFNTTYLYFFLTSFFWFSFTILNAQIDLELSLSQSNQNPDAWTNYSIVATLSNKGPQVAQGIEVDLSNPTGTVYQGSNEFTATAGTFFPYSNSKGWIIPSLAANETAEITINLFTLTENIAPVYAQVKSASPQDIDSAPNNGVAPIVAEDDEAYSSNIQANRPDLRLANVQITGSGQKGIDIPYYLDLVNSGEETAIGDYTINVYLSQNPGQTASGTWVGEINTGNTPVGTISNVSGAINIPVNYPAGNWYAIFYVDAENDITESNENNNIISRPFEVLNNGGPIGGFCGFENEYFTMPEFLYNPRPNLSQVVKAENGNYEFKVRNGNSQVGYNYVDLLIDEKGNQISIDTDADPFVNADNLLDNGGNYEAEKNGTSGFRVLVRNANNNIVFNKNYNNLTNSSRSSLTEPKVVRKANGYYLYGSWVASQGSNTTYIYLAELDANGNLLGFKEESHNGPAEALELNAVSVLSSGDIIVSIESTTVRDIFLARMNLQGTSWKELIIADLVSNRVPSIQYSAPQNSVYALLFFANEQYVRKVNAGNGSTTWNTKLSDEFNPNSNSIRIFNLATNMIITDDGGVTTGYVFRGPTDSQFQTEIGKLDQNGNAVWWRQFDWEEVNLLAPLASTSDGGILFSGRTATDYVIYKLNQNGQPTPQCDDTPDGENIDLELTMSTNNSYPSQWSFLTTTLNLSNSGAKSASNVVVNVNLPNGVVYRGGNEYNASQGDFETYGNDNGNWNVGSLASGATAQIQITYFVKSTNQLNYYAQVIAATENDSDSTPNNGSFGVVNEDDEAAITINDQGQPLNRAVENENEESLIFKFRKIFPNPTMEGTLNFILSSSDAQFSKVQVYNSQGMLIHSENLEISKGINQQSISIDQLSAGIYFLMIQNDKMKVATAKFVVVRK